MQLDGLLADAEAAADLPVGEALGDQGGHLGLARASARRPRPPARPPSGGRPARRHRGSRHGPAGVPLALGGRGAQGAVQRGGRGRPGCRASASVGEGHHLRCRRRRGSEQPRGGCARRRAPGPPRLAPQGTARCRAGHRPRRAAAGRGRAARRPDRVGRSPGAGPPTPSRQAQTALPSGSPSASNSSSDSLSSRSASPIAVPRRAPAGRGRGRPRPCPARCRAARAWCARPVERGGLVEVAARPSDVAEEGARHRRFGAPRMHRLRRGTGRAAPRPRRVGRGRRPRPRPPAAPRPGPRGRPVRRRRPR